MSISKPLEFYVQLLTKICYVKLLFELLTENKLHINLFNRVKFENR